MSASPIAITGMSRRNIFRDGLSRMLSNRVTAVALLVVVLLVIIAVVAPWIAPYAPSKIDLVQRLKPISAAHWLGTDEVGRDILTRLMYGARISIGASVAIVAAAAVAGAILGTTAAYASRWVDPVIMRAMDVVLSFPSLVLAIALAAALGPSLFNAALAIAIIKLPLYTRLAYSEALSVREHLYVRAARTYGIGGWWIIRRHIIPNVQASILVQTALDIGDAILTIATLGFLGLGAQPPIPEWGAMISVGWHYLLSAWWYPTFTGAAIFVAVMSFNLLGDGIRDLLDPTSVD